MNRSFRIISMILAGLFGLALVTSSEFTLRDYTNFGNFHQLEGTDFAIIGYIGRSGPTINSGDGNFQLSSGFFAQTQNVPPAGVQIPGGFQTQSNTAVSNLQIEWNIIKGVRDYEIQWDTVATATFTNPIGSQTLQSNQFSFSDLDHNRTYYWRVRALSSTGSSGEWSGVNTFTTKLAPPAYALTEAGIGTISLAWDPIEGTENYELLANDGQGGSLATIEPANVTSTSDTSASIAGLIPGATYSFAIYASKSGLGNSDTSQVVNVTLLSAPATAVVIDPVKVNNSNAKRVDVTWTKPAGVYDSLRIYRKLSTATDYVQLEAFSFESTDLSYSDTDSRLIAGENYDYKVSTLNSEGIETDVELGATVLPNLPLLSNFSVDNAFEGIVGDTVLYGIRVATPVGDTSLVKLFFSVDGGNQFTESIHTNVVNVPQTGTVNLDIEWYSAQDAALQDVYTEDVVVKIEAVVEKYDDFTEFDTPSVDVDNEAPAVPSDEIVLASVPWNKLAVTWTAAVDSTPVSYTLRQTSPETNVLASDVSDTSFELVGDENSAEQNFAFEVRAQDQFGNSSSWNNVSGSTTPGYVGDYDNDGRVRASDLLEFALAWGGDHGDVQQATANLFPYDGDYPLINPRASDDNLDHRDLAAFTGQWNALIGNSKREFLAKTSDQSPEKLRVPSLESFSFSPRLDDVGDIRFASFQITHSADIKVDSLVFTRPSSFRLHRIDSAETVVFVDYVDFKAWNGEAEALFTVYAGATGAEGESIISILSSAGLGGDEPAFEQFQQFEVEELPQEFALGKNYPNPFNPSTNIEYALPQEVAVSLKVYDALGREVATLVNSIQPAGKYTVRFDASRLSSGVYFYRMQSGSYVNVQKMLLVK